MLYNVIPTFESVDKILKYDQWKLLSSTLNSCRVVYYAEKGGSNF